MALLALGGRPQPLKKPSQGQKGHFSDKINVLNDTKTLELAESGKKIGNICDCQWQLSGCGLQANIQEAKDNLTTHTKNCTKIKPDIELLRPKKAERKSMHFVNVISTLACV